MNKIFVLFSGVTFYPSGGLGDDVFVCDSIAQARAKMTDYHFNGWAHIAEFDGMKFKIVSVWDETKKEWINE